MLCKKRITILLGAGSSIETGAPTTDSITTALCDAEQSAFTPQHNVYIVKFIRLLRNKLDKYYSPQNANFEDLLHTIESLLSLRVIGNEKAIKDFKPALFAFIHSFDRKFLNQTLLYHARDEFYKTIPELVHDYSESFKSQIEQHSWFQDFWCELQGNYRFDIFTLNYDDVIEYCLSKFEDGYESSENPSRFHIKKLLITKLNRIVHLHGSILFGYPSTELYNKYALEEESSDLWKYKSYSDAKRTWISHSGSKLQSKEQISTGPIITGLRKTEKILYYPFTAYRFLLEKCLVENPSLLIIGYGFGDYYINSLLYKFARIHKNKRKICMVTKFRDPEYWHRDPSAMDWPSNESMSFIARSFYEEYPFNSYYSFPGKIVSKDKKAALYLRGFENLCKNESKWLLNFLR